MTRVVLILSTLTITAAIVVVLSGIRIPLIEWVGLVRMHLQNTGVLGVIVFVILYCAATLFFIPVLPLTLLAGLVYGMWGFALAMLSATIAACLTFLLARNLFQGYFSSLMKNKAVFMAIKHAVTQDQWKIVILLRMSPVLSFAMQNYLLAMTEMRFWPYALGSALGMMPAIAFQVYIGSLGSTAEEGSLHRGFLVVGVVASITVLVLISYRTRQAINLMKIEYQKK